MVNESVTLDSKALERFNQALDSMRVNHKLQSKLRETMRLCLQQVELVLQELAKRSEAALLIDKSEEGALSASANERTLTFIPASTIALDSHLHHARCMLAAQVLIFGHGEEDRGSALIGSFRIYADGIGSNGSTRWRLDNADGSLFSYIVELLAETLLAPEICWPHNEDFADEVRFLPLSSGKADAGKLPAACIGFECSLTRGRVKKY